MLLAAYLVQFKHSEKGTVGCPHECYHVLLVKYGIHKSVTLMLLTSLIIPVAGVPQMQLQPGNQYPPQQGKQLLLAASICLPPRFVLNICKTMVTDQAGPPATGPNFGAPTSL